MPEDCTSPARAPLARSQFSLRALFVLVTAVAVVFALIASSHGMLWRMLAPWGWPGYCAVPVMALSGWFAWYRRDAAAGVCLLALAWQLMIADAAMGVFHACSHLPANSPWSHIRLLMPAYRGILSDIALASLLSIFPAWAIVARIDKPLPRGAGWLVVSVLVALIDVILVSMLMVAIMTAVITEYGLDYSWSGL